MGLGSLVGKTWTRTKPSIAGKSVEIWTCPACDFSNSEYLDFCERCQIRKSKSSSKSDPFVLAEAKFKNGGRRVSPVDHAAMRDEDPFLTAAFYIRHAMEVPTDTSDMVGKG